MRLSPAPVDFKEASPGKDQATDLGWSFWSSQSVLYIQASILTEEMGNTDFCTTWRGKSLCDKLAH